jgi:hypothetical protein
MLVLQHDDPEKRARSGTRASTQRRLCVRRLRREGRYRNEKSLRAYPRNPGRLRAAEEETRRVRPGFHAGFASNYADRFESTLSMSG